MADEKKTATAKRVNGPRPLYLLWNQPLPEGLELVGSTRKAEEALEAIDSETAGAYSRTMVK